MKRLAYFVMTLSIATAACGDEGLLDGLGNRAQRAVVGTTTTSEAPEEPGRRDGGAGVKSSAAVPWFNDGIEGEAIGLPSYTIGEVWERGHEAGRFIQSSRAEISVALPGIQFPAQVPDEVTTITSQLVYLEDVASLDAGTSAAFGLWELEPYTSDEGRVGVLRVGSDRGDVELGEVRAEVVTAGVSLIWSDGRYRYELFCRAALPEDSCRAMVGAMVPLRNLLMAAL